MFNAEKSKCLAFLSKNRRYLSELLINGLFNIGNNPTEFVQSYSHLGHIINTKLSDDDDILSRRCSFVGQVNNVLCYFGKLDSHVKHRLFNSYCTNFLDVNCGLSRMKRSMIYALHGGKAVVGFLNCLITLIVFCYLCWVIACRCSTRSVDVLLILYVVVLYMSLI
jgi:hypothetical protein